MLRKIIVILCMLGLLGFSCSLLKKSEPQEKIDVRDKEDVIQKEEEKLPETLYTFNVENLPEECTEQNEMLCAVEQAIKCTINVDMKNCSNLNLPKFIFMNDQSIERPTEISYKFVNKKVLPNNTIEIYTDSVCNARWFGLCQGTVIYVLTPTGNNIKEWRVKDIYAIE
ncbi:MAG: hypothetical protein J6N49_00785 [Alphaproteobacteria bacterium]|nr:hypothetical protein [Alphaproteobacteria bacterium]